MDITLKGRTNYNTKLYNYLCLLKDDEVYSSKHIPAMKHPADILIDQLETVNRNIINIRSCQLLDIALAVNGLYLAIDSYYDNCFNIIKCLHPPSNSTELFASKWLKTSGIKSGDKFFQYTNGHHEFFSYPANKIKHDSPKVVPISFTNVNTKNVINGFFFGRIIKENKIGPDDTIHKNYKNQRTAFSVNFLIKKAIGHLFYYDYSLYRVLSGETKESTFKQNEIFIELVKLCIDSSDEYFFNEYIIPTAMYKKDVNNYCIKFPKTHTAHIPKTYDYRISTIIEGNPRMNPTSGYAPYCGKIGK